MVGASDEVHFKENEGFFGLILFKKVQMDTLPSRCLLKCLKENLLVLGRGDLHGVALQWDDNAEAVFIVEGRMSENFFC